ncbi:hypothetical protein AB0D47_36065 [Streptomyces sp. NPDC048376]
MKVEPDATVTEMDLPEADARAAIRELLGSRDTVDQGHLLPPRCAPCPR